MVAVLQEPTTTVTLRLLPSPSATGGHAAQALARDYLRYASALWSGDAGGRAFGSWLDQFRCDQMPPAPLGAPDAVSPHGGGGRGIRWYETPTADLGYVPGTDTGYRVPTGGASAA